MIPSPHVLLVFALAACDGGSAKSDDDSDIVETDDNPDPSCAEVPSDAPTEDLLTPGGVSVACYYGPEVGGYCRDIQSAVQAEQVAGGDKAAIGCADAIVVTDGTCPLDKLVGRCDGWTPEETRYYYTCNQYDELFDGGPQESCESGGGTWVAP